MIFSVAVGIPCVGEPLLMKSTCSIDHYVAPTIEQSIAIRPLRHVSQAITVMNFRSNKPSVFLLKTSTLVANAATLLTSNAPVTLVIDFPCEFHFHVYLLNQMFGYL